MLIYITYAISLLEKARERVLSYVISSSFGLRVSPYLVVSVNSNSILKSGRTHLSCKQVHARLISRVLSKIRQRIIDHSSWWTCIPYTKLPPAKFIVVLLHTETQTKTKLPPSKYIVVLLPHEDSNETKDFARLCAVGLQLHE